MRRIVILVVLCLAGVVIIGAGKSEFSDYLNRRIDALVSQLGSDQWELREQATEELVEIGLPARTALEKALASPDAEVKERASQIIYLLRWREPFIKRFDRFMDQLRKKNISDNLVVQDVIGFMSRDDTVFKLLDILKEPNLPADMRPKIIASIRGNYSVNFQPVSASIFELYKQEKDESTRAAWIQLLGRCGRNDEVIAALVATLKEPGNQVRSASLSALAEIGDSSVIPEFLNLLKGSDNSIKSSVLYALNRFRDESVTKELVKVMKAESIAGLRVQATGMLANYVDTKLIPDFLEVLRKDKDLDTCRVALDALARFRNDKTIAPVLVELYKTVPPPIQPNVLGAIQSLGDRAVMPQLLAILEQETNYDTFNTILGTVQGLAGGQRFAPQAMPQSVKDDILNRAKDWYSKNKPG